MELLLYAIGFYLLLFIARYLLIFLHLQKLTIQYPHHEIQPSETVPAYLKTLFKQPVTELSQLGFKFCNFLLVNPMIKLDFPKDWEILLYHPVHKTYAIVGIRQGIEPTHLFSTTFFTYFKDRTLLITLNGTSYGLLGEIPNAVVEDPYTPDTRIHWQAHEARLQQLAVTKTPVGLAPADFLKALEQHLKVYIDYQVKAGQIAQVQKESLFKWRIVPLLKRLPGIAQGASKEATIGKQRKQLALTDPSLKVDIPVELEVRQFRRMEQLQQGNGKSKLRFWIVFVSFAVFVASYTTLFSPETLAIFVGALLLHEGGHILAMKRFGYRDTSMLFLPFLGALATARKDDATVTQKFWVSFAGPIPGLILGIGLAIAIRGGDYPAWMTEASWILIGLNLFNLLPVYPLDGGQIADLLVFSRVPLLGVVFKAVGVLLLVLLGLGQPMMMGFALLIGLTIPLSFRNDRMNAKLRKEFSQLQSSDPETFLSLIFTKIKQSSQETLPFAKKFALAKALLQRRSEARAKWTTQLFLSLLYCVSLIGGLVGVLEALLPNWQNTIPMAFEDPSTRLKRRLEDVNTALKANPQDVDAYLKRAQIQMFLKNYDAAIADATRAIQLDPNSYRAYNFRSSARRLQGDKQGALADAQKATVLSDAKLFEETSERLRLNPNDGRAYLLRARLLVTRQDYKGAIADCNQAIRIKPQYALAYLERGIAWKELKNYKQAIADADQAIRFNANFTEAYKLRAEIRHQLGDKPGAIADQRKVEELLQKEDPDVS